MLRHWEMSKKTGAEGRLLETTKLDYSTHRIAMLQSTNDNRMPKKKARATPPKLTDSEQGLLARLEQGYQLETDSLGSNPVLRRLKDNEVLRPADANASTVRALEQRGLIRPAKGHDPLILVWRLT